MPTDREDIENEHAVYTCRCGFVDFGHATPAIVRDLWTHVLHESDVVDTDHGFTIDENPAYLVRYFQQQTVARVYDITGETVHAVRRGLSIPQRKSAALRIFMDTAVAFETAQGQPPWRLAGSSFAVEDLMSDLIGFHMEVLGMTQDDVRDECHAVSVEA